VSRDSVVDSDILIGCMRLTDVTVMPYDTIRYDSDSELRT